jgi:hypothetical protein
MSELEKLREENRVMRVALNTCKHDYWMMSTILEMSKHKDEEHLKDCIERMNFRKPMFNILKPPSPQVKEEHVADSFVCERCHHAWYAFDNCCDYPKRPAGEVLKQEGGEK